MKKRFNSNKYPAVVLIIYLLYNFLFSQTWHSTGGPERAEVAGIESFDSVLLAGCMPGGVYRSTDHGESWNLVGEGQTGKWITNISEMGNMILASSLASGLSPLALSFSYDNGAHWTQNPNSWSFMGIEAMAVVNHVIIVDLQQGELFRSEDTAKTWQIITDVYNGAFKNVNSFAVDGNIVYAATRGGIMKSVDEGKTWLNINGNMRDSTEYGKFDSFFLRNIVAHGDTLFTCGQGGIYRSLNGGKTWDSVFIDSTISSLSGLSMHGENVIAGTYYRGLLISDDFGETWRWSSAFKNMIIYALSYIGDTIFAGVSDGIYVSGDKGNTWTLKNYGLSSLAISSLAVFHDSLFCGSTNGGVFVYGPNGPPFWRQLINGFASVSVISVTGCNNHLFAGVLGTGMDSSEGSIYRLDNDRWIKKPFPPVPDIHVRIYSTYCLDTTLYIGNSGRLYETNDGGENYTTLATILASGATEYMALSGRENELYIGTNGGITIYNRDSLKYTESNLHNLVFCIEHNETSIFAGVWRGGVYNTGVYKSLDRGRTWQQTSLAIPSTLPVLALACKGDTVYAGTGGLGVFRSCDDGATWQPINSGLLCPLVKALCFYKGTLYAGTNGSGVYYLNTNESNIRSRHSNNSIHLGCGVDIRYDKYKGLIISNKITRTEMLKIVLYDATGRIIFKRDNINGAYIGNLIVPCSAPLKAGVYIAVVAGKVRLFEKKIAILSQKQ